MRAGRFADAEERFNEVLKIQNEIRNTSGQARIWPRLAKLYDLRDETETAIDAIEKSLVATELLYGATASHKLGRHLCPKYLNDTSTVPIS